MQVNTLLGLDLERHPCLFRTWMHAETVVSKAFWQKDSLLPSLPGNLLLDIENSIEFDINLHSVVKGYSVSVFDGVSGW